jgi:hypothetical protein
MFYEAIYRSVLYDLLTTYTRKFIKILLRGEQYPGEYKRCKDSIELLQKQFMLEEKRSDYNISVSAPQKLSINISRG